MLPSPASGAAKAAGHRPARGSPASRRRASRSRRRRRQRVTKTLKSTLQGPRAKVGPALVLVGETKGALNRVLDDVVGGRRRRRKAAWHGGGAAGRARPGPRGARRCRGPRDGGPAWRGGRGKSGTGAGRSGSRHRGPPWMPGAIARPCHGWTRKSSRNSARARLASAVQRLCPESNGVYPTIDARPTPRGPPPDPRGR